MLSAISAETLKLRRHKATWFLVWLYPIAFFVISVLAIMVDVSGLDGNPATRPVSAGQWVAETAVIWDVPGLSLGRCLISAFVAVVFAGEYGWNTWKLVVPHRSRVALLASKYVAVVALLAAAYALTAAITLVMSWLEDVLTGDPLPAALNAAMLLKAHGEGALGALPPALLTIAYTSLAAILTRSTIAALVIGLVVVTAEQLFVNFAPMFALYAPDLIWLLYHALPGYHLANLGSWIDDGVAFQMQFPSGVVALHWATSLVAAAAWIAALTALTLAAFKRQDIN